MTPQEALVILFVGGALVGGAVNLNHQIYEKGYQEGWQAEALKEMSDNRVLWTDGYQSGMARCIQDQKGYQ